MGKVIIVKFRRSRLPRRLLNDGWWLESPPARPSVVAFPRRGAPKPKPKARHLTLVTLWGTMVFFLVTITASGQPRGRVALVSATIAVCVELFRLIHYPWLDDFRMTLAGALLLGRIFSPWNMLAYGVGILSGMQLDRFARMRS
jgi:hypothetical protein